MIDQFLTIMLPKYLLDYYQFLQPKQPLKEVYQKHPNLEPIINRIKQQSADQNDMINTRSGVFVKFLQQSRTFDNHNNVSIFSNGQLMLDKINEMKVQEAELRRLQSISSDEANLENLVKMQELRVEQLKQARAEELQQQRQLIIDQKKTFNFGGQLIANFLEREAQFKNDRLKQQEEYNQIVAQKQSELYSSTHVISSLSKV